MKVWQSWGRRRVLWVTCAFVMLWVVTQGFVWLIGASEQELTAEGRELFIRHFPCGQVFWHAYLL